jgi:hypothetical protein
VTDPVRREALRARAAHLRARIGLGVGAVFCFAIAGFLWSEHERSPVKHGVVGGIYAVIGVALLAFALLLRATPERDDVPDADPAEAERAPTRAEWTVLVLRSLGYGVALWFMTVVAFESGLGLSISDALPFPTALHPRRAVWLTCVALLALAQGAYYLAPRSPEDRRARVTGQPDSDLIPWWEPYLIAGLSIVSVMVFVGI